MRSEFSLSKAAEESDEEDKEDDLQSKEKKILRRAGVAQREAIVMNNTIQQYSLTVNMQSAQEDDSDRQELLRELQEQKLSNQAYVKACEDPLNAVRAERGEYKIGLTKATNHSNAVSGFINASAEFQDKLRGNFTIGDTVADGHSFAGAGVLNDINVHGDA